MIELLVVVVVVLAVFVGLRARRFGGLAAAFSRSDKAQRTELVAARKVVQQAGKDRDARLAPVRQAADAAVGSYAQRVAQAEQALGLARTPGHGPQLLRLGAVTLHEHVLVMAGQVVPLLDLQVAVQPTYNTAALVVQLPDGRRVSQSFSTEWRTDSQGRRSREFEDEQVQRLADAVHNAVVAEQQFRAGQPRLVAEAEAALAVAQGDTTAMAVALARLDEAQQQAPFTDEALAAHERLVVLEDRWAARLAKQGRQLSA
ncbi:MAG: hypothetical protein JWO60_453 [Frankiales bacterium]|nr:hypothetical protein [Frankiales bacterium]